MFTTEYGIASLVLAEIPYRQEAYIRVQTAAEGMIAQLIDECVGFCRACGAEKIYASGCEELEQYPQHCVVYEMKGDAPEGDIACLWPVTEQTAAQFRSIANERLQSVDNAATITAKSMDKMLADGGAYFIHEDGNLLGIGWVSGDTLRLIASMKPGAGERVMRTLLSAAGEDRIRLEVASTNERAIHLYEKMGFLKTAILGQWYRVFG